MEAPCSLRHVRCSLNVTLDWDIQPMQLDADSISHVEAADTADVQKSVRIKTPDNRLSIPHR